MSRTIKKASTGAKAVSSRCRNNGGCDYCKGNKLHKHKRKEINDDVHYTLERNHDRI